MPVKKFVKSGLKLHGVKVKRSDVPYIKGMLLAVKQMEKPLDRWKNHLKSSPTSMRRPLSPPSTKGCSNMTDLAFMDAFRLARMIENKELSPVELTERMIGRIKRLNPEINAYLSPLESAAREQAAAAEKEIMAGIYKGPLHGIPVGIKDNYKTKGIRTTAGSKLLGDFTPDINATVVDKLSAGGAVMLGKLNMQPFGAGLAGHNQDFGAPRNPWNKKNIPGGSSSGSVAALASGMAAVVTGTDTFGSNRVPAAFTGVYGLKPTYGLVSTHGIFPSAWSLDTAGPIARSVPDLAIMLEHMAGFDPDDPTSLRTSPQNYMEGLDADIRGMKIGIPDYYIQGLDKSVEKLFKSAVAILEEIGAEVREMEIPELSLAPFAGFVTTAGEAAAYNYEGMKKYPEAYPKDVRVLLSTGLLSSTAQYEKAQQARRKLVEGLQKAFTEVDVLLGPTAPMTAPKISSKPGAQSLEVVQKCTPFTVPANLAGIPALSVPMGMDKKGLPAGMQFMGPHLSEKKLLQLARAWEETGPLKKKYGELEVNRL